jgi:hypothetical protein
MRRKIVLAVMIIAIVAVMLTAFVTLNGIHPVSTPAVEVIVDGNLTVNSGSYMYYNFTVFSQHVEPAVQGTFTVSGIDQKIRVYIMNSANFTNWARYGQRKHVLRQWRVKQWQRHSHSASWKLRSRVR